jgi:regulator of protease activity HflC (stomatin/prohibitin superfamily)
MQERSFKLTEFKGPKSRSAKIIIVLLILLFIIGWSTFVIVPAGHRGVVLLWGSVEKRIMGE